MSLLDDWKNARHLGRITEDAAYGIAVREVEANVRDDGLWGRAFAGSGGNMDKAKADYIGLRAEAIISEAEMIRRKEKQKEKERMEMLVNNHEGIQKIKKRREIEIWIGRRIAAFVTILVILVAAGAIIEFLMEGN